MKGRYSMPKIACSDCGVEINSGSMDSHQLTHALEGLGDGIELDKSIADILPAAKGKPRILPFSQMPQFDTIEEADADLAPAATGLPASDELEEDSRESAQVIAPETLGSIYKQIFQVTAELMETSALVDEGQVDPGLLTDAQAQLLVTLTHEFVNEQLYARFGDNASIGLGIIMLLLMKGQIYMAAYKLKRDTRQIVSIESEIAEPPDGSTARGHGIIFPRYDSEDPS